MATEHGKAGEWARVKGTVFGLWPLFLCAAALGFSVAFALFAQPLAGAVLSAFVLVATLFAIQRGLGRVERYFKGARGEERVAGILRSLPEGKE